MRAGDGDGDGLASEFGGIAGEVDHTEAARISMEEFGVFGGLALDQDLVGFADALLVFGEGDLALGGDEFIEAIFTDLGGDLRHGGGGGAGSGGVAEHVGTIELEALHGG